MADSITVFIDTTLDTHLAFLVSAFDTVSDLKKKILHEHKLCFPNNGDIKIHALKVKRRGIFYNLSESMLVKSVFDGISKNWFVSVDASIIEDHNDNVVALVGTTNNGPTDKFNLLPDSHPKRLSNVVDLSLLLDESGQLPKQKASVADQLGSDVAGKEQLNSSSLVEYKGDHYSKVTSLADNSSGPDLPIQEKYDEPRKEIEVQATAAGGVKGDSGDGIGDMHVSAPSDGALPAGSGAKKKNKRKRKSKYDSDDLAVKEKDDSVCQSGENESQQLSVSKKRRKVEEEHVGDDSKKENEIFCSDSNKETSEHPTISQHHSVNSQKNAHSTLDSLSSENLDGVNLPSACPSSGKGKRKGKAYPLNLETAGVPSSTEDVREESMEVNPNDFSKEANTAAVPVQGVTISESFDVSVKGKHICPVQEKERPSSKEVLMSDKDTTIAKDRHDAPEIATASAAKKGSPKNIILDDSQTPATDQVDGFEEERESLHPESVPHEKCKPSDMSSKEAVNTSELVEASETLNPGTQSKKRKKSKRTRDLLSTTPTSGTDNFTSSAAADAASKVCMSDKDTTNAKDRRDAPEIATASAAKKGSPKNTILDDSQTPATDQVDGLEEERESFHPESVPHEKCKPSDMSSKEAVNTSELVEASETLNPGTQSKKRKKSKRTRDLLGTTPTSGTDNFTSSAAADVASIEPHEAVNGDGSNDKGNQEDSNMAAKEGKEISEMDKELAVTSQLVEASEAANPGTQRKKSKRMRDLLSRTPGSGTENVNSSAAADAASADRHKAVNGDDSKDKVNQQESNLPAKEGKEVVEMDKFVVTSGVVEASEIVNPGMPSRKGKKSKRTTELLSKTPASGIEHVNSSAVADSASTDPNKTMNGNDSNDKVNQEQSNLLAKEGKEVSKMGKEVVVTSELVEASEAVNPGTPSKKRKKSKQTRDLLRGTPTSGTLHANDSVAATLPTKPDNAMNGDDSNDNGNKEESNTAAKKGKVVLEMDAASTFRLATDTEIDDVIENVVKSAANGCPSKIDHCDKAGHGMEVPCGSNKINFNEYFVPSQDHCETAASGEVLVDKATTAKEVGGKNSNKKKKKLDAHSHGPSSDLHGSLRLSGNDGIGEKPPAGRVKVPPSSKLDKISSTPAESRKSGALRPVVTNTYTKNNKGPSAVSNSSLESSKNTRATGHGSNKEHNQMNGRNVSPSNIEVVNSSQPKKSLIGKSGTIFQDDTYERSADNRTDSSDSSTRTPSDNSLSSDHSDGESNSDFNSSKNGNYSLKNKNIKKPLSGLTLEKILKSSSRYKKAKLTASELQLEDTESEPVEFVPDSQANP